ncbi:MAG TPA: NADH-quinone oxidoreductase subunit NuoG [Stellaceae bacterium]|nr:NADH-quinone oxidoreductase subunit NuoG [Stellaceae bacterium]
MTRIHIDGRDYEAKAGDNLLQACLELGMDLPYFCWHPAMGSVGACRQCAVRQYADENDKSGRIVMACMTPVTEGGRFSIADEEAKEFRASVIEWLMTNHPHDCPVCEEGGECHLQDMTVMTGHAYRRYRFTKRTHRNQNLGPFVKHEMNRCIACYRCVRFYRDYAGGQDLDVFASHDHVYFGRQADGVLESEFSGNLVEVCPTGVFTDKTLSAYYSRKWDMRGAPSICAHCGLGCNTIVNERDGRVRRILNRYHGEVNGYFLCDRGRFGYGFVEAPQRLRTPKLRDGQEQRPISGGDALTFFAARLNHGGRVVGIGSPRASMEANFALRALVGPENFHLGIAEGERQRLELIIDILRHGGIRTPSLKETESADAVFVLGEDVPETAPRLALALRQSIRQAGFAIARKYKVPHWQDAAVRIITGETRSPMFIATPMTTRLDDIAAEALRAAPDDIARLGFAVAHRIDAAAPAVPNADDELLQRADRIAEALLRAQHPLIVSGTGTSLAAIEAAASIAQALKNKSKAPGISFAVPECNSLGLVLMGGGSLAQALNNDHETLIVLENDLYRRASRAEVDTALMAAVKLVVLDCIESGTAARADLLLPAGSFAETDGTLINSEGRAQRFFKAVYDQDGIRESWRWLTQAGAEAGRSTQLGWSHIDDVTAALAAALPELAGAVRAAPGHGFRVAGSRIRSEPHRFSGRTALHADTSVHEPKPPQTQDAPFSATMEGYYGQMPAALMPFFWAPSWNSVQSLNKFQAEIGGASRGGDAGTRLLEPGRDVARAYYDLIPERYAPRPDAWLAVPMPRLFGGEELSALSPSIVARGSAPKAYLCEADAARLDLTADMMIEIVLGDIRRQLPIDIRHDLPAGLVGIPADLTSGIDLPRWATLSPLRGGQS